MTLAVRLLSEPTGGAEPAAEPADPTAVRAAAAVLARSLPEGRTNLARPDLTGSRLTAFVEGLLLGAYRFSLSAAPAERAVDLAAGDDRDAFDRGLRSGRATLWARDLANMPAATKTPAWLAEQARRELEPVGVTVQIRDEEWLQAQGCGGILAVGSASSAPPRLIEAAWRPRRTAAQPHVVLVGKGITFDTGGLNLKRGESMRAMKTDMSGGAVVLAAVRAAAEAGLPLRVTALVPAAENSFGAASYRPGDVVRHFGGRTSEIGNTDAEGRIVLADALAYAVKRLRPSVLVDVATLTGAMKTALGVRIGGLFTSTDDLAESLIAAGADAGEPLWRMPLAADYENQLRSDMADANNAPGNPGGITAALFLQHFTGGLPWAHLDIAGPARADDDDGILTKGATGFGARLLVRWLESMT